ncbi:MAG: TspO/MBR family protein [candidate division WOR-3 bacterium]
MSVQNFNIVKFIASLILTLGAGFIGSMATRQSVSTWYGTINKPPISPPNWLFGPVWTALFILMGIAFYLVWNKGFSELSVKTAMIIFLIQLALNILWSFLFFGLRSPLYAFIEIIILWIAILLTIIYFFKVSYVAGYLLIPYILWVSFASILNGWIAVLN